MTEALDSAATALRTAVASGQFDLTPALVERYVALVEQTACRMPGADPQLGRLEEEARETLNMVREGALAQKAHAAARLKEVRMARQYGAETAVEHITEILG